MKPEEPVSIPPARLLEMLLREEIERHDGGSPHVNYCWWCQRDVNGIFDPPEPHADDCWYVRTMAALVAGPAVPPAQVAEEPKKVPYPTPEIVAERVEAYILHARAQGAMCSKSQIALYRSYPDAMRRGELHPWYGPCDGMGTNGECSECELYTDVPREKEDASQSGSEITTVTRNDAHHVYLAGTHRPRTDETA